MRLGPLQCHSRDEKKPAFGLNLLREKETAIDEMYSLWYDGKIILPNAGRVCAKRVPDDDLLPKPEMPTLKIGHNMPSKL